MTDKRGYLESLAVIACASANAKAAWDYLASLATSFDVEGFDTRPDRQVEATGMLCVGSGTFRRDAIAWTWLADATFVACLCGRTDAGGRQAVLDTAAAMELPVPESADFIRHVEAIALDGDPRRIVASIRAIAAHGGAWKAIADYRGLRFDGAFDALCDGLNNLNDAVAVAQLRLDLAAERWNVFECMSGFPEEGFGGFARRTVVNVRRRMCVSNFAAFRRRVQELAGRTDGHVREAQAIACAFGLPPTRKAMPVLSAQPDLNVDYANDRWNDRMDEAYDALDAYLDALESTLDDASDQLACIAEGQW